MKRASFQFATGTAALACMILASDAVGQGPSTGPNKVVQTAKTGGDGGFDYIYADSGGRKLYIPRTGQQNARIDVFNLDTLAPIGSIPNANARAPPPTRNPATASSAAARLSCSTRRRSQ